MYPGASRVSGLKYRSNDSTAQWQPSATHHPAVAFLYELSLENGTTLQSSRVTDTELHLPGLEEGKTYVLDVWEQCDGQWESEHSHMCFQGANSSVGLLLRAVGSTLNQGQSDTWWFWFERHRFHLTIHRTFYVFCSVQHISGIVSEMTIQGGWNRKKNHVKSISSVQAEILYLICLTVFHDNPSLPYS